MAPFAHANGYTRQPIGEAPSEGGANAVLFMDFDLPRPPRLKWSGLRCERSSLLVKVEKGSSETMAIKAMRKFEWQKSWFILESLVTKDFKLKYRRSVLGILWSILNPLLMMIVLSAVFSMFLKWDNIENFPLYLILGTVLFSLMQNSTTAAMHSILEAAPLIKKVRVEKMIFPVEKAAFELVNFAISLVAVVAVMAFFRVAPTWHIVMLPLLLLYVVAFSIGIGLLLAALAVFFRDVCHLWGVVITAWTYGTPIFYPVTLLDPFMQQVMQFNPMFHYVMYFRDIAMWGINPGIKENLVCFVMAAITFLVGYLVFRKTESKFILYV